MSSRSTEQDIIYLNELRRIDPEAYTIKLKILGISDKDISNRGKQNVYYMCGRPYVGDPIPGFLPKSADFTDPVSPKAKKPIEKERKNAQKRGETLYLVDGDNHVYEGLDKLRESECVGEKDIVVVYVT